MNNWKWSGYAGHLCVGHRCRFHLNTDVGDYIVSTVGDYFDHRDDRQTIGAGKDDFYETMVFKAGEVCADSSCDCGTRQPADWSEVDCARSSTPGEAHLTHMEYCVKYAKKSEGNDNEK